MKVVTVICLIFLWECLFDASSMLCVQAEEKVTSRLWQFDDVEQHKLPPGFGV